MSAKNYSPLEETEPNSERTVIIGADDSRTAEHALDWYMLHLHKAENRVFIVHSIEVHGAHPYPSVFVRPEIVQAEFEKAKVAASDIETKFQSKLVDYKCKGTFQTECGKPGHVLVQLAKEKQAEMIVVGTRGRGKIRRTILGSVSDYIVHHAHCPVITVRKAAKI